MHTWCLRLARLETREAQVSHITSQSTSFFLSSLHNLPSRCFPERFFAQAFTVPKPLLPPCAAGVRTPVQKYMSRASVTHDVPVSKFHSVWSQWIALCQSFSLVFFSTQAPEGRAFEENCLLHVSYLVCDPWVLLRLWRNILEVVPFFKDLDPTLLLDSSAAATAATSLVLLFFPSSRAGRPPEPTSYLCMPGACLRHSCAGCLLPDARVLFRFTVPPEVSQVFVLVATGRAQPRDNCSSRPHSGTSVDRTGQHCSQLSFLDARQRLSPQQSSGHLDVKFLQVFCCFSVCCLSEPPFSRRLPNFVLPMAFWTLGDMQPFSFCARSPMTTQVA